MRVSGSLCSSEIMFFSEGGAGTPRCTLKASPWACRGPWYGSCPMMTTLIWSNGHRLSAVKIWSSGGNIVCCLFSPSRNRINAWK